MSEQFVLDLAQPEPPSFDNFVAGANREAMAALIALARGESRETGLLLWGAPGAGKTHLLRATAAMAARARAVIECVTPGDVPAADTLPASALLVVDRIDGADAVEQARLFTVLNALAASAGQWVACAGAPPARLSLRDDLRTRLGWGAVHRLALLSDEEKAAALKLAAHGRGLILPDELVRYLLVHRSRDIRALLQLLDALDRFALERKRPLTLPLLREFDASERQA